MLSHFLAVLESKMKPTFALVIFGTIVLSINNYVNAWGGIYNNRFSPEMLQNMGYGASHRVYDPEVCRVIEKDVILILVTKIFDLFH